MRNYIHVVDLARAHVTKVNYIRELSAFKAINVGTENGITVLEIVREFEGQSGKKVKCQIVPRRPGDATEFWGDVSKARRRLGFQA